MSDAQSTPAVVVGIDGSKSAIHAARWAVDEAVSRDIPLRLVYVIDPKAHSALNDGERLSSARSALRDAHTAVAAAAPEVKVETEILWGRPLTKLAEESRSAVMICVGSIGLNHACHGDGSTAAALAGWALCPVAVIRGPTDRAAAPRVGGVIAQVDNGVVLRRAFEEARLRQAPLHVIVTSRVDESDDGSRSAQAQLSRRLARWTRLYPDVRVDPVIVCGGVGKYLADHGTSDQLFVTDSVAGARLSGAYGAGCSVLAVRWGNL